MTGAITLSFAGQTPTGTDNFGSGMVADDYGTLATDGFTVQNLYRTDLQFVSYTPAFAGSYYYDGPGVVNMAVGGSGTFAIKLAPTSGQPFNLTSLQVDTPNSHPAFLAGATTPSVTITGNLAGGGSVSQSFALDSVQGLQTLTLSNAFQNLSSALIAPNFANMQFDNIVVTPNSTTETWIDGTSGDFAAAANWVQDTTPGATTNAQVIGVQSERVTIDTTSSLAGLSINDKAGAVVVDDALTVSGALSVTGGQLEIDDALTVQGATSLGAAVAGLQTIVLNDGGTLDAAGGLTLTGNGGVEATGASGSVDTLIGPVTFNNGYEIGPNGSGVTLLIEGSVSGAGVLVAGGGEETLALQGAVASAVQVDLGSTTTLALEAGADFEGTITTATSTISLASGATFAPSAVVFEISPYSGYYAVVDFKGVTAAAYSNGFVTLTETGGATASFAAEISSGGGTPGAVGADDAFQAASDGNGGLYVSFAPTFNDLWQGGSGNWSTASAWSYGYAPTSSDAAVFQGTLTENVALTSAADVGSVVVNDQNATVEIESQLTVQGVAEVEQGFLEVGVGGVLDALGGLKLDQTNGALAFLLSGAGPNGSSGTGTVNGAIVNDEEISAGGGETLVVNGAITGTGFVAVTGGFTLNGAASQEIDLYGGGVLTLDQASAVTSGIYLVPEYGVTAPAALNLAGATRFAGSLIFADGATTLDLQHIIATATNVGDDVVLTEQSGATLSLTAYLRSSGTSPDLAYAVSRASDNAGGTLLTLTQVAPKTWAGGSGTWSTAADWSPAGAPTAASEATIGGTTAETITVASPADAYSLEVDNPNATVNIDDDLTLTTSLVDSGQINLGRDPGGMTTLVAPAGVTIRTGGGLADNWATTISGNVVDNGALDVQSFLDITGSLSGSGTTTVDDALEIGGAVSQNIDLKGGWLRLDDPTAFTGEITGMSAKAYSGYPALLLTGITGASATYSQGVLTVTSDQGVLTFDVDGALLGDAVVYASPLTLNVGANYVASTQVGFSAGLAQTWLGGSGDWTDASKWSAGFAPTIDDAVTIDGASALTVSVVAGETAYAHSVTFAGLVALQIAGALELQAGGALDDVALTLAGGTLDAVPPPASSGFIGNPLGFQITLGAQSSLVSTGSSFVEGASLVSRGKLDVSGVLSIAGGLDIEGLATVENYAALESNAAFVNGGTITVDAYGGLGGGAFSNTGAVTLGADASASFAALTTAFSALSGQTDEYLNIWSNAGTIDVGAGDTLTLGGNFSVSSLAGIDYAGATLVLNGAPLDDGELEQFANNSQDNVIGGGGATLTATGGRLALDLAGANFYNQSYSDGLPQGYIQEVIASGAQLAIDAGSVLEIGGGSTPADVNDDPLPTVAGTVTFNAAGATLQLDSITTFAGALAGVTGGDVIDFSGMNVTSAVVTTDANGDNTLTVFNATSDSSMSWAINQYFAQGQLQLSDDGGDGTKLTFSTGPAQISVAQYEADPTSYDADPYGFEIVDSADDLLPALDALSADPALKGISLTDPGTPTLALTLAQALNDGAALAKIATPFAVALDDSGARIAALTSAQAAALQAAGYSVITANTAAMLSLAEANLLAGAGLAVTGAPVFVQGTASAMLALAPSQAAAFQSDGYYLEVVDSAAHIDNLTATQILSLAASGLISLRATDAAPKFAQASAAALVAGGVAVFAPSGAAIYVSDVAANIVKLSATELGALEALGVSGVISTNAGVNLTADQAAELESLGWTIAVPAGALRVLRDTAAGIAGLTAAQIRLLPSIGLTSASVIDAGAVLTVAQAEAFATAGLPLAPPSGDANAVFDLAAQIEGLTIGEIGGLAKLHVGGVSASDAALALSASQALALANAKIALGAPAGDGVLVSDLAATLEALTPAQIASLAGAGVNAFAAVDASLTFSEAAAAALAAGGVALRAPVGDVVLVADAGANLSKLSATQIAVLASLGVSGLTSTSGGVSLSAEQAAELETLGWTVAVPSGATRLLRDAAAAISGLSAAQIQLLPAIGVVAASATGAGVALTVAQAAAFETANVTLTPPSGATNAISDAATQIETLSVAEVNGLARLHVASVTASDAGLTLSVAQARALLSARIALHAPPGDAVAVSDAAATLDGLTAAQITGLAALGVTSLSPTDAGLTLSYAQAVALEAGGVSVASPGPSLLSDKAVNLEQLTAPQIDGLAGLDVTGLVATNANVSFNAAQSAALVDDHVTVAAAGSFTATENFADGGYLVYRAGALITEKSVNADGSFDVQHFGVTGLAYSAYEDIYTSGRTLLAEARQMNDGTGALLLRANGEEIVSGPATLSLTSGGDTFALAPFASEAITSSARTGETFAYEAGFGASSILGFAVAGSGHDVLQVQSAMFADATTLLAHAVQSGANLVITDAGGDTITLDNVTKANLTANSGDLTFV